MKYTAIALITLSVCAAFLVGCYSLRGSGASLADPAHRPSVHAQTAAGQETVPLKEAKLNIEHNATDNDTGF